MDVVMDVRLVSREPDRVGVVVHLTPKHATVTLDGVAVELLSRQGESIGPRMMLPIAGRLAGPLQTAVELRTSVGELYLGGTVTVTAWEGNQQLTASCPADMWTAFERHVKGSEPVLPAESNESLESLEPEELRALWAAFTWLKEPEPAPEPELDDLVEELGLDDEDAAWLRDLMNEDD